MCFFFFLLNQTKATYKLIIKASDLGGRAGGNTGTGEITINIRDINDNVPTLEKEFVGFTHLCFNFFETILFDIFSEAVVAVCSMLPACKRTL